MSDPLLARIHTAMAEWIADHPVETQITEAMLVAIVRGEVEHERDRCLTLAQRYWRIADSGNVDAVFADLTSDIRCP